MTSFHLQVVAIADNGQRHTHEVASLERTELQPETLGLTLAESKALLRELQRVVVEHQVAEFRGGTILLSRLRAPQAEQGVPRSSDADRLRQDYDPELAVCSL
jgi:hypothetical protein